MNPMPRVALLLMAQDDAVEWLNSLPGRPADAPPFDLGSANAEPFICLVDAVESPQALDELVRERANSMFEAWLSSWTEEQSLWPLDRSIEAFSRFFQVALSSLVFDFSSEAPPKEASRLILPS